MKSSDFKNTQLDKIIIVTNKVDPPSEDGGSTYRYRRSYYSYNDHRGISKPYVIFNGVAVTDQINWTADEVDSCEILNSFTDLKLLLNESVSRGTSFHGWKVLIPHPINKSHPGYEVPLHHSSFSNLMSEGNISNGIITSEVVILPEGEIFGGHTLVVKDGKTHKEFIKEHGQTEVGSAKSSIRKSTVNKFPLGSILSDGKLLVAKALQVAVSKNSNTGEIRRTGTSGIGYTFNAYSWYSTNGTARNSMHSVSRSDLELLSKHKTKLDISDIGDVIKIPKSNSSTDSFYSQVFSSGKYEVRDNKFPKEESWFKDLWSVIGEGVKARIESNKRYHSTYYPLSKEKLIFTDIKQADAFIKYYNENLPSENPEKVSIRERYIQFIINNYGGYKNKNNEGSSTGRSYSYWGTNLHTLNFKN